MTKEERNKLLDCAKYLLGQALSIWEFADKHFIDEPEKLKITNKECRQLIEWANLIFDIRKR